MYNLNDYSTRMVDSLKIAVFYYTCVLYMPTNFNPSKKKKINML